MISVKFKGKKIMLRNRQIDEFHFEKEPYSGPLTNLPQVLLTPHMGSYAKEARSQMEQDAAKNLVQGLTQKGLLPSDS